MQNEFAKMLLRALIPVVILNTALWSWVISRLDETPTVTVDNAVAIGSSTFRPLHIINPRSTRLDGLILVVPRHVDPSKIIASAPISMTAFDGELTLSEGRRLKVNGIAASQAVTILIPDEQGAGFSDVSVLDEGETHVRVYRKGAVIGGRVLTAGLLGLAAAVVGVAPWLLVAGFLKSQLNRASEETARLEKMMGQNEKVTNALVEPMKRQVAELRRHRIFLQARLGQYARELEFWRDAVRKNLYQQGSEKKEVQMFLQKISESLETYSTHKRVSTDAVLAIFEEHLQASRPQPSSTPG